MKYRQLSCQDTLDELVELVNAAYRGITGTRRWTTEAHLVQGDRLQKVDLERQVASGEIALYTGYRDEKPVCCIALKRDDQVTEFGMFAVDPELHCLGFGKQLLDMAESEARPYSRLFRVSVVTQNVDLIRFYERRGYSRTGEILATRLASVLASQ
jgi:ribosomal protein S18 acetylase RimI-like enzyme